MSNIIPELEALSDKRNVRVAVITPKHPEARAMDNLEFMIADFGYHTSGILANESSFWRVSDKLSAVSFESGAINTFIDAVKKYHPHILYFNIIPGYHGFAVGLATLLGAYIGNEDKNCTFMLNDSATLNADIIKPAIEWGHFVVLYRFNIDDFARQIAAAPGVLENALNAVGEETAREGNSMQHLGKVGFKISKAYQALLECQPKLSQEVFIEIGVRLSLSFNVLFKEPLDKVYLKNLAS